MRTYALVLSIVVAVGATTYGDITLLGIPEISNPGPLAPLPGGALQDLMSMIQTNPPEQHNSALLLGMPSTISVIRLIHVTVSPASPSPSDPVSVTISVAASSAYLVLDRATVARQGNDVVIDLYWSDNPPPTPVYNTVQACSLGYGVEQINPTPSAILADKTYEVNELLGTFDPGMHTVHVHSHGAIEGEASALFNVRASSPAADNTFSLMQNLR